MTIFRSWSVWKQYFQCLENCASNSFFLFQRYEYLIVHRHVNTIRTKVHLPLHMYAYHIMIIISYLPYRYRGNHGNDNEYSQNVKSVKVPKGNQQSLNETGTIYGVERPVVLQNQYQRFTACYNNSQFNCSRKYDSNYN